jgi:outer membrane protein TolC
MGSESMMKICLRICRRGLPLLFFAAALGVRGQEQPAGVEEQPVGVREVVRQVLDQDPRVRASAEATRLAYATYHQAVADALPQVRFSSSYSLDLVPDWTGETLVLEPPLPYYEQQQAINQGSHSLNTRLSVSQLLPTSGTLSLSLENTMSVLTAESVSTNGGPFEAVDPQYSQAPTLNLSLNQPLFLNGKLLDMELFPAVLRKARTGYLKEEQGDRDTRNGAISQALELYFSVVNLRRSIANTERALEITEQKLGHAQDNYRLGLLAETDVWEIQVGLGEQKEGLLELRYSLQQAEASLAQSLGREDLAGLSFSGGVPELPLDLSPAELRERALENHPLVRQEILLLQERRDERILAGQRHASNLSLGFGLTPLYPEDRTDEGFAGSFSELFGEGASLDYRFSIGLSIPIYEGGKEAYEAQGNRSLEAMAEQNLQLRKKAIVQELSSLELKRQNLEQRVELLQDNAGLLERRTEIERSLLGLGRSTELEVAGRQVEAEAKGNELEQARAELLLTVLKLYALAGEDLQKIVEDGEL